MVRLIHDTEELKNIDNCLLQNISSNKQCKIKRILITIETGKSYSEIVELKTDFREIKVHMPNVQSFYQQRLGNSLSNG